MQKRQPAARLALVLRLCLHQLAQRRLVGGKALAKVAGVGEGAGCRVQQALRIWHEVNAEGE